MTDEFIPSTQDEIDAAFLTGVLREAGALTTGRVSSIRAQDIGEGHGFACQVSRLHLDYDSTDAEGPRSIVAKLPTQNRKNRMGVEAM